MSKSKKMKTSHAAAAAADLPAYTYSPSNVFAHMQTGHTNAVLLFDRQHTFALLDNLPASPGHALLVLKHPVATLLDPVPSDVMAAAMEDLQVLSRAVQAATKCEGEDPPCLYS